MKRMTRVNLLNVFSILGVISFMLVLPWWTGQTDRNALQFTAILLGFLTAALIPTLSRACIILGETKQALSAAQAREALISKTEAMLHQAFCICFNDVSFPDARRYAPWHDRLLELNDGMDKVVECVQNGTLPQLPKPGVLSLKDSQKAALHQLFSGTDVR